MKLEFGVKYLATFRNLTVFLESNTNIMLIQFEFVIVKESQGKSYAPAAEVNPILS